MLRFGKRLGAGDVEVMVSEAITAIMPLDFTTQDAIACCCGPQAAVAAPDEGGTLVVHSATQSLDTVQRAVARTLGLQDNKVRLGQG